MEGPRMSTAYQRTATRSPMSSLVTHLAWWILFLVCGVYALFAFYLALVGALSLLGFAVDARPRAAPVIFIVHALAGGVALIAGPLQLNRHIVQRWRRLHRASGR